MERGDGPKRRASEGFRGASGLDLAYPAADDSSLQFRLPGHARPASFHLASCRRAALGRPARAMLGMFLCALLCAGAADAQTLGLGRPATAADIDGWGAIVGPEGAELPPGGATAAEGRAIYDRRCSACHGPTGTEGPDDRLAGGQGSLATDGARKTVGSYWPAATTLWDYVYRAMPFNQPGSLTADEVYGAVAYVLFLNDLVGENDEIDAAALPRIDMPNRDGFVPDPRPDMALPAEAQAIRIERLLDGPIITPDMDGRMGSNIAGPSLIRVPDWVENPLGRYYLYFADHRGTYIRLAYADDLAGPWTMHEPGTLQIEQSHFPTTCPPCGADSPNPAGAYAHVASPDVHVDDERQQIVMYVHGRERGPQVTRAAVSTDGLHFEGRPEILGRPYFRAFRHDGYWYALAMPGVMYRSRDGLTDFEEGPSLFNPNMRHSALLKRGNRLFVFWTERGDAPERVWLASIDLSGDWRDWNATGREEVLRPEMPWEGADLPVEPSRGGAINVPVNQLRDPAIYEEDGRIYFLYAVAGERGIALAEVHLEP